MRGKGKTGRRRLAVGDVLRMTSFADENVVAHYVLNSPEQGPFIEVYRGPPSDEVTSLEGYQRLFGPISCGIAPPVRSGDWVVVGRVPSTLARLPMFLMPGVGLPPDEPPVWWLFDGVRERPIGRDVPPDLRELEILQGWSGELVEERVRTGVDDFSYEATMKPYRSH